VHVVCPDTGIECVALPRVCVPGLRDPGKALDGAVRCMVQIDHRMSLEKSIGITQASIARL